jgi:N4-gp56 family major capsid protein
MANMTTGTDNLDAQFQTYFSKELLEYIVKSLQLVQFANKSPLPAKAGAKDVKWFRYDEPATTGVTKLTTEGGTSITERALTLEEVTATLVQYGQVISLTDILQLTELFSHMEQAIRVTGQDAALHADTIVRDKLGTTTVAAGKQARYANGLANYAAVQTESTVANAVVEFNDLLDCATALNQNNTSTIGGSFIAVASPEVISDLMKTTGWQNAASYSAVEQLFKGEVGKLWGNRIMSTTSPFKSGVVDTYLSSGNVHSTFVFGANAFGVTDIASQSPYAPKVMIADGADKSDPLNQLTKISYKSYYAAAVLQPKYFVEMYSQTAFS